MTKITLKIHTLNTAQMIQNTAAVGKFSFFVICMLSMCTIKLITAMKHLSEPSN